jgi:hypothetical protein
MDEQITFLPWLRRGLAQALTAVDPLSGPIARGPSITARVGVLDVEATRTVRLHGPDQVTGLAPGQVLRSEPRPDSGEVEPTMFPYVELAAPDLPWLYTPAAPDGDGRLRPWLVLVVVREQDGVELELRSGALPVLRVDSSLSDELPDLADSWAWVHVQSLVGLQGTADTVAAGGGEVIARLVCPRRLAPGSAWLACVVPAFDGGVALGLGQAVPEGADWQPAWGDGNVGPLPVYHYWRFATGAEGDFEALCRRLKPDDSGVAFGLHAMDVTDPGLIPAAPHRVLLDFEGALETEGVHPRAWTTADKTAFQGPLEPLLNAAAVRADYDPAVFEPLVGPPLYGQWPAEAPSVPADGWVRSLNLHPARRAAAGLGARVVRAGQEELVASAWDQAGSLRATVTTLGHARLAVELGRRLAGRVATLADGDALQLTAPLQALLGPGARSIKSRLAAATIPAGLVSPTHLRLTRDGTPLARDWPALTGATAGRLGAEHVETTLAATGDDSKLSALTFAAYGRLLAAQISDPTVDVPAPSLPAELRPPAPRRPIRIGAPTPTGQAEPSIVIGEDVSGIAADVIEALDPLAAVRASVLARVPALAGGLAPGALPSTLRLAPSFESPLYDDLAALGAGFLLPGADGLPRNRVRLLATNATFVGAFLIGANHELARELLWRGYPVDLRATFFHCFWSYVDPQRTDIDDLAGWTDGLSIADNMGQSAADMTVFVVRGDLVRRYPSAHYFLQKAQIDPSTGGIGPVPDEVEAASFGGMLDAETLFVGFGKKPTVVIGHRASGGDPGWLLAIEEQPAAPRFGLDDPPADGHVVVYGKPPDTWDDLSWANVARSERALAGLTHAPADVPWLASAPIPGASWGRNGAHMARACWQRPFRMYIPADQLD